MSVVRSPPPPLPLPPAWNVRPTAIGDKCGPIGACDSDLGPYLAPLYTPSPILYQLPRWQCSIYACGGSPWLDVTPPPPGPPTHRGRGGGGGAEQSFKMLLHQKKPAGYLSISLAATRPRAKRGQN